jgi:hypothetical protein
MPSGIYTILANGAAILRDSSDISHSSNELVLWQSKWKETVQTE